MNLEVDKYFRSAGMTPRWLPKAEHTEFMKLRCTTLYGVNIEFARYTKDVCDSLGIDYVSIQAWDAEYNRLYQALGMPQFHRYELTPPTGKLGGHCVLPNAKLLNNFSPNSLIETILKNNE